MRTLYEQKPECQKGAGGKDRGFSKRKVEVRLVRDNLTIMEQRGNV